MDSDPIELVALQDALGAAKWSRALFTTYSLSLGFFEAYLLPRLEAVGCSDITILVDSGFYLESLSERQARWAGKAYRLLPIGQPGNRIFHPKLAYLWGDEGDVVAIGSGNLTYAGHGGNLECLDYISAKDDGPLFDDVAGFFLALIESSVVTSKETRAILRQFHDRAEYSARKGGAKRGEYPSRVLHSITRSIYDQVVDELAPYGKFRRVTVVSPFHSEDGELTLRLGRALQAAHVDFCLDPATTGTPLPYKKLLLAKKPKVSFVLPSWEEHRPLHAKWYEFEGPVSFMLTGSVNATETSFASTSNVEVAVLRPRAPRRGTLWIESPRAVRIPTVFSAAASPYQGWLTGNLTEEGVLSGRLFGVAAPEGNWRGELHVDLNRARLGLITVNADGEFETAAGRDFVEPDAAIRLLLRRGSDSVAGWISLQHLLSATGEARGARLALGRLSHGSALQGDIDRVIHWLTEFLQARIEGPTPRSRPETPTRPSNEGARRIGYDEWAAGETPVRVHGHNVGSLVHRALEVLARGPSLGGRRGRQDFEQQHPGEESPGEPTDDMGPSSEEFDHLEGFWRFIDIVLENHSALPIATDLVEYRAEHAVNSGFGAPEVLGARCIELLRLVARLPFSDTQKTQITPVFASMAGLVQSLNGADRQGAMAAELRQLIERFLGRQIDAEIADIASKGFEHRAFSVLHDERKKQAIAALAQVITTKTVRDELLQFIVCARSGIRPLASPKLRQSLSEAILSEVYSRRADKCPYVDAATTAIAACPACHVGIDASERTELRSKRAIRCRGCGRAIVWLGV